jgi:hypothetical protein
MATEDRFMTAFSSLVRRALDNDGTIDRRALYPAKVVKWEASGIFPSGTVDVIFNNDDAGESATKLQTISGVPVLPPVAGIAYKPQAGTQCLIGWQGADERLPYATGWLGLGGSSQTDIVALTVNLGDNVGTKVIVLQPIVPALNTVLAAVGAFATAMGSILAIPAIVTAAATLNTAIGVFTAGAATYTTIKTKAT